MTLREPWADAKVIGFVGAVFITTYAILHPPQTWQFILEILRFIKGG